jgi:hypothetical protein
VAAIPNEEHHKGELAPLLKSYYLVRNQKFTNIFKNWHK